MSAPEKGGPPKDFVGNLRSKEAKAKALDEARKTPQKPRRATNTGKSGGYVAVGISENLDLIRNAAPNTRNVTVNTALFNIGTMGRENIDIEEVKSLVRAEARAIGLPDSEIDLLLRDGGGLDDGMSRPRDMSTKNTRRTRDSNVVRMPGAPPPPTKAPPLDELVFDAEGEFWTSRESLQQIYIAALSKLASPWAVIAACTALALATVPARITLPPIVGGPGSLNWFGALTAVSGGGKGAAMNVAEQLVTVPVRQRNSGSGEGMLAAYIRPEDKVTGEPKGLHDSIMFNVDEIDSLTGQSARSGSQTMPVLRSAFSGERLGFSYINKNTPILEKHTYRMTMLVGIQPQRAAGILADSDGGTPQRFMWFPAKDPRVTDALTDEWIAALDIPSPVDWKYDKVLTVPKSCRDTIIRERVRNMKGELDALDGHALFVREKFAFALALLDGRTEMTEEDWELSELAAKVSDATRYWIGNLVEEARIVEDMKRGESQAISSMAADAKRMNVAATERRRLEDRILGWLKDAGLEGLPKRVMQRKLADKGSKFDDTVADLVEAGLVRVEGTGTKRRWYVS